MTGVELSKVSRSHYQYIMHDFPLQMGHPARSFALPDALVAVLLVRKSEGSSIILKKLAGRMMKEYDALAHQGSLSD